MRAALAEMVRVVTPGGRIVVQDYLADEDPERAELWERVERLRDPDHRRLPRPGEVSELLAEHGFGEDEVADLDGVAGRSTTGWRWRNRRTRRRRRSAGWWRRTRSS